MCCRGTLRHPTTHTTRESLAAHRWRALRSYLVCCRGLSRPWQFSSSLLSQQFNILLLRPTGLSLSLPNLQILGKLLWVIHTMIVLHFLNIIFTVMVVVPVSTPTHPGTHLRAVHWRALRSYPGRAWVPPTKTLTTPLPVWRARGMGVSDRWRALRSYLCPVPSVRRVLSRYFPLLLRQPLNPVKLLRQPPNPVKRQPLSPVKLLRQPRTPAQ